MSSCLSSVLLHKDLYIVHDSGVLYLMIVAGLRRPLKFFLLSHLWGSSYFLLILSISIRVFVPNIRWTFILFLTTGPFIFLFIEGWKVHFFPFPLSHFASDCVVYISHVAQPPSCLHAGRSFSPSFFLHLWRLFSPSFFHVWSSSSPSFFLHLWRLFSPSFSGDTFLFLLHFPSMREIPFIGSLSTTPTRIGPFFPLGLKGYFT